MCFAQVAGVRRLKNAGSGSGDLVTLSSHWTKALILAVHCAATVYRTPIMKRDRCLTVVIAASSLAVSYVEAFVAPGGEWRSPGHLRQRPRERNRVPMRDTCGATNAWHHTPFEGSVSRVRPIYSGVEASESFDEREGSDVEPLVITACQLEAVRQHGEDEKSEPHGGRWAALKRSFTRGAVSLAALTFGATAMSGMSAELKNRMGISIPGAVVSARASVFRPFTRRTVEEKLGNLPAFMVTNFKGSPYLAPSEEDGVQVRN